MTNPNHDRKNGSAPDPRMYALQLHFRSWCLNHGVPCPISEDDLSEMYRLSGAEFCQALRKTVQDGKIAYPLQDAGSLLSVGADGSADTPLAVCCEAAGVSVEAVTGMLFQ